MADLVLFYIPHCYYGQGQTETLKFSMQVGEFAHGQLYV